MCRGGGGCLQHQKLNEFNTVINNLITKLTDQWTVYGIKLYYIPQKQPWYIAHASWFVTNVSVLSKLNQFVSYRIITRSFCAFYFTFYLAQSSLHHIIALVIVLSLSFWLCFMFRSIYTWNNLSNSTFPLKQNLLLKNDNIVLKYFWSWRNFIEFKLQLKLLLYYFFWTIN